MKRVYLLRDLDDTFECANKLGVEESRLTAFVARIMHKYNVKFPVFIIYSDEYATLRTGVKFGTAMLRYSSADTEDTLVQGVSRYTASGAEIFGVSSKEIVTIDLTDI